MLQLVGAIVIVYGVSLINYPLSVILAGIMLLVYAVLWEMTSGSRKTNQTSD